MVDARWSGMVGKAPVAICINRNLGEAFAYCAVFHAEQYDIITTFTTSKPPSTSLAAVHSIPVRNCPYSFRVIF